MENILASIKLLSFYAILLLRLSIQGVTTYLPAPITRELLTPQFLLTVIGQRVLILSKPWVVAVARMPSRRYKLFLQGLLQPSAHNSPCQWMGDPLHFLNSRLSLAREIQTRNR